MNRNETTTQVADLEKKLGIENLAQFIPKG
jgi:hypothetical protein